MKLQRIALSLVAMAITTPVIGTAAQASSPSPSPSSQDCRTVTTTLVNRPDNGHGTPGHWANDNLTRKLTVCHVAVRVNPLGSVAVDTWTYSAGLTDTGTFVTVPSVHNSPNHGATLATATGTVTGNVTFNLFTAPHDWIAWDDSAVNGKTFNDQGAKTDPSSTGNWVSLVWKDGYDGKGTIASYNWTYKTCSEQWIDANTNDDGTGSGAGDITGKTCPSPSPSPVVSHSPSVRTSATTPTSVGLPVTGGHTPLLLGLAGGVILVGTGLLVLGRRRV